MDVSHRLIREHPVAPLLICLAVGVASFYLYGLARGILAPLVISLGGALIDPYSDNVWLLTLVLNVGYSALCGLLVALFGITVIHYLLRPNRALYYLVAAIPYIIMSYWWFVADVQGFMGAASTEHIWITLLSPLAAILVWLASSVWWVNRDAPNK
jgi:hypothetical protein